MKGRFTMDDIKHTSTTEESASTKDSSPKGKPNRASRRASYKKFKDSKWTKGHNDVSWLKYNQALAEVASRVSFGCPLGLPQVAMIDTGSSGTGDISYTVPGIMAIYGIFSGGVATSISDPINQAGLDIYIYMRHKNAGAVVRDPNDVTLFVLTITQLIAICGWLERVAGEIQKASPLNWYDRKGLINAEGLNYEDLVSHQAEFLFYVAWFRSQVNNFIFPKLHIFANAYEQFHRVYKDYNISKSQYYMFVPAQIGVYNGTYDTSGGGLEYKWIGTSGNPSATVINDGTQISYTQLTKLLTATLNAALNDTDVSSLTADLLKAYGAENLFRIADISPLDMNAEIVSDGEALMQIHNLEAFKFKSGLVYRSVVPGVSQSPYVVMSNVSGAVEVQESIAYVGGEFKLRNCFDMMTDSPSNDEVLLASRYKHTYSLKYINPSNYKILTSSDVFIPHTCKVYTRIPSSGQFTNAAIYQLVTPTNNLGTQVPFDYSPMVFSWDSSTYTLRMPTEIFNMTFVDEEVVQRIHLNNILSVLETPTFK